jgi:hypothetical protein
MDAIPTSSWLYNLNTDDNGVRSTIQDRRLTMIDHHLALRDTNRAAIHADNTDFAIQRNHERHENSVQRLELILQEELLTDSESHMYHRRIDDLRAAHRIRNDVLYSVFIRQQQIWLALRHSSDVKEQHATQSRLRHDHNDTGTFNA